MVVSRRRSAPAGREAAGVAAGSFRAAHPCPHLVAHPSKLQLPTRLTRLSSPRRAWYNQGTLVGLDGHFKRGRQADLSSTLLRRWRDRLAKRLRVAHAQGLRVSATGHHRGGRKVLYFTPPPELSRCVARARAARAAGADRGAMMRTAMRTAGLRLATSAAALQARPAACSLRLAAAPSRSLSGGGGGGGGTMGGTRSWRRTGRPTPRSATRA
eukprot:SAG22_NODE_1098_length_5567_cov_27.664045_5_plen_213_part_00